MRNQTSFRLTSTLLPTDTTATTTTVINKVDSNGDKFYPTFTEETVVLTNDDRTVMETTRAICTDGAITFTKRGLSDDAGETQVPNRKLTRNPWTLAFITAWAWDWIDKDDSITWTGNQTYTGNLTSTGSATYNWLLTTNKWVKYPSFENLEALEAYNDPFPWMFAVLESDWELYRYNAVTETWSVVTTSEPTNPPQASTSTIWTVRGATAAEFSAWTATGSQWELLVATPAQIKSATPAMDLHVTNLNQSSPSSWHSSWATSTINYTVTHAWFITVKWSEYITSASISSNEDSCNYMSYSWTANPIAASRHYVNNLNGATWYANWIFTHIDLIAVWPWTFTATMKLRADIPSAYNCQFLLDNFFYFA